MKVRKQGDLIDAIAGDIAANLRHYIRSMYPKAVEATAETFLTSVGNVVRSDVEAVLRGSHDEAAIRRRLDERARHRRRISRLRDTNWEQHEPNVVLAMLKAGDEVND